MIRAGDEIGYMIDASAKVLCPKKTGTLARSLTHVVTEKKDKVRTTNGSKVEYAYFVELKKPYLEPAVDENIGRINEKIKEVLGT